LYYFVINPNSGNGNAGLIWRDIRRHLNSYGIKFDFSKTKEPNHATSITLDAVSEGFRSIICVGGDGTLNEVVNGILTQSEILSSEINLGMIPTGTGNDWCRSHNIPSNPEEALHLIIKNKIQRQDIGRVIYLNENNKQRYFANVAGFGFDAVVANNVNKDKQMGKSGIVLFVKNLLKSLMTGKSEDLQICIDNEEFSMKVFTMAVGIGRYNGGGMMQLPDAEINDGLLDITVISDISKFDVLRYAPLLFNGKFVKHPKVFCYRGNEVTISSASSFPIEVEGESAGSLPVKIEIIPSALSVFSGITDKNTLEIT